jgi:excinuclease UvrABC ATPase subunit
VNERIIINGISTNNLKNIDVYLIPHAINLIIGPSGSGKSSLAYDTIAKIGLHELSSMYSDISFEADYKVESYKNMLVTIPIKQNNNNTNIHSTIGTYFNINSNIALIYSTMLDMPYEYFILNRAENICSNCHGLGFKKILDINRVVDYSIPLENCPMKCWNKNKDFYKQMINNYCYEKKIDMRKNFRNLTKKEQDYILNGESDKKYTIKYRHANLISTRTTKYYGILTDKPMLRDFSPNYKFYTETECPICNGKKYSTDHDNIKLFNLSIGELMCTPFSELNIWLKKINKDNIKYNLKFAISIITNFINKAIELKMGYLFFNRIIPSLSGGELQRLRLIQVFNSQISNLLIVLDEPLASLSNEEKNIVFNNIIALIKKHTLLIVDHHNMFYKNASNIIALGEKSGKLGGTIINTQKYITSQKIKNNIPKKDYSNKDLLHLMCDNTIYFFKGIDLQIAKECMNIISGHSGVGKSTVLREYLPRILEDYLYISQKIIIGNSNSTVATLLDILLLIINNFSERCKIDRRYFFNSSGSAGVCPKCNGIGYIAYGSDYQEKIFMPCPECNSTGFNKSLKKYKILNYNIFDIMEMTIEECFDFYSNIDENIANILKDSKDILLGHLRIGQKTSTLSGGENIRIKLLKSIKERYYIYGIDEPFRGLNNIEIYTVIVFLQKYLENKKTIIVVDHEEESFKYFSKHIILDNINGMLLGK